MKIVVDTCGWVEWLTNGSLAGQFKKYLNKTSDLIVPSLLQYELYKWILRAKGPELALQIIGVTEQSTIVPIDTQLALFAAELSNEHGLAMADAIMYGTALLHNAVLITADSHFQNLPNVEFFSKK